MGTASSEQNRIDRLALQSFSEFQQHLRHLAAAWQPVRTRTVVPLLIAIQRQLQTQILNLQLLIPHLQFSAALLLTGTPLLLVALPQQRVDPRFQ